MYEGEDVRQPLSVSAAMNLAKGALESVTVRVLGEVSEVNSKAGYKAVYFSIKDTKATLPCMMWNNRYAASGVTLTVGALVELTGRFTLYAAKGRMNFDVFSVSLAGEGRLRMQVAQLARKLESEGLMDAARKRKLPLFPEVVGVVTSPRGAVVHDALRTMRRRFPVARVLVAGVPVEGAQAPLGMIRGIEAVVAAGAQVVLLMRGGGSFEDLMPFNDENLARAIAACPVPVVTGIGHEPDTTIADMVADVRASTPTAAAEAVTPAREALITRLDALTRNLRAPVELRLQRERMRLGRFESMRLFTEPEHLFADEAQMLDDLSDRLHTALPAALAHDHSALDLCRHRLALCGPRIPLVTRHRLENRRERLRMEGTRLTDRFSRDLALAAARLDDLSPLSVLGRGYAIATAEDGAVVSRISQVAKGDRLSVAVSDGSLDCVVERTRESKSTFEPLRR